MSEWFSNLVQQLGALPPARQAMLAITAVGSLAFFGWLAVSAGTPQYRALYRGLPEDQTARVADALAAENIDYRLGDGGTSILVPAGEVYEARIRVAGRGLPSGSAAGLELFDRPAFGVTDFVHRVNYMRAVQGELSRSIEQLDPIERARVQVVIPERTSVLSSRNRRPSAAVVLSLAPGREVRPEQARAIVHLVASSVESLDPADVTVVDGQGRLLAPLDDGLPAGSMAAGGAPQYQNRVEAELAERIEAILEKTVGPGGVIARVRADMDWTESETTLEKFDPDSQVARSEQRSSESSAEGGAGGVPGVVANSPDAGAAAQADGAGTSTNRSSETVNFEISKTVSRTVTPMGRIQRLSIAVLVADQPGTGETAEPAPWDDESIALFDSLSRQAVGFDEKRGDQITVSSAPFRMPEIEIEEGFGLTPEVVLLIGTLARGGAVLIALLLFARMVVKPTLATVSSPAMGGAVSLSELEERLAGSGEPGAIAPGTMIGDLPEMAATIADQVGASAGMRQEESVKTLRNWLSQE